MTRYAKNQHPYIYAAFPTDKAEAVMPLLTALNAEGVRFWYAEAFKRSEKRKIAGAFGVLLFVTAAFAQEPRFRQTVDAAVACGQKILCVYLEPVQPTPWLALQLGSQQDMRLDVPEKAFIAKLKEAYIFREMEVTATQKRFQRNKAVSLVLVPLAAAAVLFFTVLEPLLIAPKQKKNRLAEQWGLTAEDLESVTEFHIIGDTVFDSDVHAWYSDGEREWMEFDRNVDGNMERQTTVAVGSLTSSDLQIVQYMPNLTVLEVEGEQITDISWLYDTNIECLRLNCNPITSIEGIEQMTELRQLILTDTDVTDISPAFALPNLQHLQVDNTYVRDISGVENVSTLNTLMISNTQIATLPTFGAVEDLTLDLRGLRIYDFSCLSNIRSYREIYIDNMGDCMRPVDLVPFLRGKPVEYVGWSGVTDLNDLADLQIIPGGRLCLANNTMTTLEGIEQFEGISVLGLFHHEGDTNTIADFSPILNLKSLESLELSPDMQAQAEAQLQGATFEITYRWG